MYTVCNNSTEGLAGLAKLDLKVFALESAAC